jgi:hypothetical protein
MVVTPNSSQSHPTLHVPSTEPRNPPVLNVRRPLLQRSGAATKAGEDFILATAVDDTLLPPTVLRLPNLDNPQGAAESTWSIASIAHWVGIVLGGLLAMALIFGGRRGAMPDPDAAPELNSPARAAAAPAAAAWVPPPLDSAGDSSAPAWNAPKPATAPAAAAPTSIETPPAATTPALTPDTNTPDEPQQEAWPRPAGDNVPASTPELPAAGTSAQAAPHVGGGPAVRTAQLEAHVDPAGNDPAASEAQPLGITVPVPQ